MSRWDDSIKMGLGSSQSHVAAGQLVLGVAPLFGAYQISAEVWLSVLLEGREPS